MDQNSASVITSLIGLLGKLIWPAVAVFFLLSFRENVRSLIDRVASVSFPGGGKFLFQKVVTTAPKPSTELVDATFELDADGFLTARSRHKVLKDAGLEAHPEFKSEFPLYQNPNQRTWMLAAEKNLYILLDDENTRSSSTLIQTFFDKTKALPLRFGIEEGTGLVGFTAEPGDWYYSLALFPTQKKLENAVRRLVK